MREITILSGKGGTGKTCLSAAFATLGHHVIMADCDVDASNLYILLKPLNFSEDRFITGHKAVLDPEKCNQCGICAEFCRFDAIEIKDEEITISETSCDGCMLCSRLCPNEAITMIASDKSRWYCGAFQFGQMAHARLYPGEENSGKLVNVVREKAKKMAGYTGIETIIIDGPPGTGCPVISSITGVNDVVVVTEPSNSGFHDMKRILELTSQFNLKTHVVINKYDLNHDKSNEIEKWCRQKEIAIAGKIPFDSRMVEAMVQCKSIIEWAPDSELSSEIRNIWKNISMETELSST